MASKPGLNVERLLLATFLVPLAVIAGLHWLAGSGGILVD